MKQLERQQKKLALKGIVVTIEQLREEQKNSRNRGESEIFSDGCSESSKSSQPEQRGDIANRDTNNAVRRTTFSIDSILGTISRGGGEDQHPPHQPSHHHKEPPSPGTLMRGAPTPPLTPRNAPSLCPTPPPTPSSMMLGSKAIPPLSPKNSCTLPPPLINMHSKSSLPSEEGDDEESENLQQAPTPRLKVNENLMSPQNIPNFNFKNWQTFMPQILHHYDPDSKRRDYESLIHHSLDSELMMNALRSNLNSKSRLISCDEEEEEDEEEIGAETRENSTNFVKIETVKDDNQNSLILSAPPLVADYNLPPIPTTTTGGGGMTTVKSPSNLLHRKFQIQDLIKRESTANSREVLSEDHSRSPLQEDPPRSHSSPEPLSDSL